MKKLALFAIVAAFCVCAKAQEKIYLGLPYAQAFQLNKDIKDLLPGYIIASADSSYKQERVEFVLVRENDKPLNVRYSNNKKDGDADLGIADKMLVDKITIYGPFLNVFKIYQSWYAPAASLDEVKASGGTYAPAGKYRVVIQRYDVNTGTWVLSIEK